jgi:hypothetical protein
VKSTFAHFRMFYGDNDMGERAVKQGENGPPARAGPGCLTAPFAYSRRSLSGGRM